MKKISMIILATATLMFVACGGSQKTDKAPSEKGTPEVEAPAPVVEADTATVSEILTQYEDVVKRTIPLLLKIQKGETKAIKEYQEVNKELTALDARLQKKAADFTEKEQKKYKELAKKIHDAATPGAVPSKK